MDNLGDVVEGETVEQTTEVEATATEQTSEEPTEATEKSEITQEDTEESSLEESKQIPYDRFKEVNDRQKELEKELIAAKAKAENWDRLEQTVKPGEPQNPELERADQQLQEMGYLRKEDAQQMMDDAVRVARIEDSFLQQADTLAEKYTGKDGLPKFDAKEVADFMDANPYYNDSRGYPDLEKTFQAMNLDEFTDGVAKQKRGTAYSEKPGKPMASTETSGKADFDEAKKSGDWTKVLLDRASNPFKN